MNHAELCSHCKAAPQKHLVCSCARQAEETAAEPVEAKDEADKPESTAAARKSKEKQKEPEADSKQVSTRSGKEPKRDSKDKKEEKPSSSSKVCAAGLV